MVERYRPSEAQGSSTVLQAVRASPPTSVYFGAKDISFLNSGCTLLNCVLGGGWPLGRVVNIVGDRSSGKCARDYFLLTADGLKYSEDFVSEMPLGVSDINWTLALDRDANARATKFWKEQVNLTYQVETRHGFELIGTPDHKLQIMRPDGQLVMCRLEEIQEGDWLVVSQGTDLFPQQAVSLAEFEPTVKVRTYVPLQNLTTLTPDLGAWLGAVIADGTTSSGPMVITAHKKWKRRWLQIWSERLFPGAFLTTPEAYKYTKQVRELVEFCYGSKLDGSTARYKRVPTLILRSPREVQAAFLSSLMSFDGEQTSGLAWSTASRRLAREVQMLLLNFGIFATLKKSFSQEYNWTYYSLLIYGERFDAFRDKIGILRPCLKPRSRTTTSDILSIPFGHAMVKNEIIALRKRLGWSRNGKLGDGRRLTTTAAFCRSTSSSSYPHFRKNLEKLRPFSSLEFQTHAEFLLRKGYAFDKIILKKRLRGEQIVSDVHVPEGHLFWASGLINHNTLLAEEAMANFQITFPKGKIFYRETEAAFDVSYAKGLGLNTDKIDFGPEGPESQWATIEDLSEDLTKQLDAFDADVARRAKLLREKNRRLSAADATTQALKTAPPSLYIVDSLDAISSTTEMTRDIRAGSYNLEKQKLLGELFRKETRRIRRARMGLIVISQIRDRIGAMIRGKQYTRAGGKALDFYASIVLFLAQIGKVSKQVKGVKRPVAVKIKLKCEKNKITMPFRECQFEIHFGYGIDSDLASLDWLKEVGRLKDAGFDKMPENLDDIDVPQLEKDVQRIWLDIEQGFRPPRGKYSLIPRRDGLVTE